MRLNILKVSILILVSSITFFSVILFQAVSISFVVNLNLVHLVTFFVILCPSLAYSDRGMYAINYPFYSFTNATIEIIILLSSFVIILNHLIHDLFLILLISSGQFSTSQMISFLITFIVQQNFSKNALFKQILISRLTSAINVWQSLRLTSDSFYNFMKILKSKLS